MHTDFFFDLKQIIPTTEAVAKEVFSSLGISVFERHETDSYSCGWYFSAVLDDLTFEFSLNEYTNESSLVYWLSIENFESQDEVEFERLVSRYLSAGLGKVSARISRVHDFGKQSMKISPL
jgi:hypothetical protein